MTFIARPSEYGGFWVRAHAAILALTISMAALGALPVAAQTGLEAPPEVAAPDPALRPIRTESPRDTLESFLTVSEELGAAILRYRTDKSAALAGRIAILSEQSVALIDLSELPLANRRERGEETDMALLDIFGRLGAPALDGAPDVDAVSDPDAPSAWRVPRTPIRIGLVREGPRAGEFLFTAGTLRAIPRFLSGIAHLPLDPPMPFERWTEMSRQLTGPLIPGWLASAMPEALRGAWLDTPAWKVLPTALLYLAAALLALALYRLLRRHKPDHRLGMLLARGVVPAAILTVATVLVPTVSRNINLSGSAAALEGSVRTIVLYLAWAWLFRLAARALAEAAIRSPRISDDSYDANMLRLISGIVGIAGIVLILAIGAQEVGVPALSLLAGLGIGGLAVALAIRPTLENLIGGFILFIDKPVRVGDFCSFGGHDGTIEGIGIRSTQIRALDRTLITVPNAQFADMQLVNWARCDQMLIRETIGLRYETTPDQLRFLLARIRELLHSHPRIDPPTVRVRFDGYGDSALNIGIRVYARTREWNGHFAVREDVFLRIYDIVTGAGSGFAFPSPTVYLGRDKGLDAAAWEAASTWMGRRPGPACRRRRPSSSPAGSRRGLSRTWAKPRGLAETQPGDDPMPDRGAHGRDGVPASAVCL